MKTLIAALGLMFASTVAFAQSAPAFSAADADGDGALSMEECKAALPNVDEAAIVAADTDNSGSLSEDEYNALTAG